MGIMSLKHKTESLQKCDLPECKNVSRTLYRVQIGDMWYKFCSGGHAQTANSRFKAKVANGITSPGIDQEERVEMPEGGADLGQFE